MQLTINDASNDAPRMAEDDVPVSIVLHVQLLRIFLNRIVDASQFCLQNDRHLVFGLGKVDLDRKSDVDSTVQGLVVALLPTFEPDFIELTRL